MHYEKPTVVDFGAIGEHTFTAGGTPGKDTRLCSKDMHEEQSCPTP